MITTEVRQALEMLAKMDPERARSAEVVLLDIEKTIGDDPLAWWGALVANGMWAAWFELVDDETKGKLPAFDVPMILSIFFDTHPLAKVAEMKYGHLRQGIPTPERGREIIREEMAKVPSAADIKNMSQKELAALADKLVEQVTRELNTKPPKQEYPDPEPPKDDRAQAKRKPRTMNWTTNINPN